MRRIRYLRLTGRQRRWVWLWLTVLLVTGLCCAAVLHMRPIIVSLATARVSNAVNRIVVDAVRDAIDSGQVNYDVLIHLEKDETGRVAALESNMAAFNRLRSQIAGEILRRLSEVSTSELSIPVGTLTGSTLLAGRGPCIRVRMQAVGSADASLRNAFSAAGINQAPDPAACGRIHRHSSAGLHRLHQGQQRDRRGGDRHCGQRSGDIHLFQHRSRGAGAVRPGLHHEQRISGLWTIKPR